LVVPAATGVTVPVVVVVLIVAVPVLEDDQALLVAAVPDPVNAVVDPTHTVAVPLIVGRAFTVTVVAVDEQPLLSVYVIFVVPAATGVTVPVVVVVLIVAVPVLEDDQALLVAAVPDPVNAVVDPIHTVDVPLIVGNAFIVALPIATF
jgi:hypothetical protein